MYLFIIQLWRPKIDLKKKMRIEKNCYLCLTDKNKSIEAYGIYQCAIFFSCFIRSLNVAVYIRRIAAAYIQMVSSLRLCVCCWNGASVKRYAWIAYKSRNRSYEIHTVALPRLILAKGNRLLPLDNVYCSVCVCR